MEKASLGRRHFREVMDYGNHPSAFADWLGEVDKFTPADWDSVTEMITYMGFRADVLERVAELKDEEHEHRTRTSHRVHLPEHGYPLPRQRRRERGAWQQPAPTKLIEIRTSGSWWQSAITLTGLLREHADQRGCAGRYRGRVRGRPRGQQLRGRSSRDEAPGLPRADPRQHVQLGQQRPDQCFVYEVWSKGEEADWIYSGCRRACTPTPERTSGAGTPGPSPSGSR